MNNLSHYSCHRLNQASVACQYVESVQYADCSDGQVRLAGGVDHLDGRIEICHGHAWFGVCAKNLYSSNKNALCKMLGYSDKGAKSYTSSFLDLPLVPLYPYEIISCPPDIVSVLDCQLSSVNCNITYDVNNHVYAALSCEGYCDHGAVRLNGSLHSNVGQVFVCVDGAWGTICSDNWRDADASVTCRQLGYSPYGAISFPPGVYFSYNDITPVLFSYLNCTGDESNILDCQYRLATSQKTCDHTSDAAVICQYTNDTVDLSCANGDLRLVGGANELEGSVEMCYNKFWGSVCHHNWQNNDANVACKQLNFQPTDSIVHTLSYYGHGVSPPIAVASCTGKEDSFMSCSHDSYYALYNCGDGSVAGVSCLEACSNGDVRMVGSLYSLSGRVEFCNKFTWRSICSTKWSYNEASVTCSELNLSPYGII
jgi:hypothetical protein